jgi:hypothetical protein
MQSKHHQHKSTMSAIPIPIFTLPLSFPYLTPHFLQLVPAAAFGQALRPYVPCIPSVKSCNIIQALGSEAAGFQNGGQILRA